MAIQSVDNLIANAGSLYTKTDPIYGYVPASTSITLLANTNVTIQRLGGAPNIPASIGSLSKVIAQNIALLTSGTGCFLIGKMVPFGSIDISGASGTWTADGGTSGSMPTVTELGNSRTAHSTVFVEVTTALNATPGSLAITYVDQDGNTSESSTAQALTASAVVGSVGHIVLNTGDVGVRSISTATRSGGTTPTGVLKLWGMIPLAFIPNHSAGSLSVENLLGAAFNPVRLSAGDSIAILTFGTVTGKVLTGCINYVGE